MKLLTFLFLAVIDGNQLLRGNQVPRFQLPIDMVSRTVIAEKIRTVSWAVIQADLLLRRGIDYHRSDACGDPSYPPERKDARKRRSPGKDGGIDRMEPILRIDRAHFEYVYGS